MGSTLRSLWLCTVLFIAYFSSANSNTITVDAHEKECFFEHFEADTKIGLTFEVTEGGFLDIDVTITGPNGTVIYNGERESSGMYTFSAPMAGIYTYCFSNQISTLTYKVITFNLEVGEPPHKETEDKDEENEIN